MRNKYNRQLPEQHQQQHHQRSMFLPMLCSSTSKQVKLSHRRCSSSASSFSEDPSSPKVGCMGQVKRNNKVVGFPTIIGFITTTTNHTSSTSTNTTLKSEHSINSSSISIVKYHKLKSFFSTKSLTNSPTATATATARTTRGGPHKAKSGGRSNNSNINRGGVDQLEGGRILCRSKIHENDGATSIGKCHSENKGSFVNLEELDPPLPVVKRVQKPEEVVEEGNKNLWKRRSGGAPLKSLQVQVIHQSNPANTV